jgi:hypothetical protein
MVAACFAHASQVILLPSLSFSSVMCSLLFPTVRPT